MSFSSDAPGQAAVIDSPGAPAEWVELATRALDAGGTRNRSVGGQAKYPLNTGPFKGQPL